MIHFKLMQYLVDRGYIRSGMRLMDVKMVLARDPLAEVRRRAQRRLRRAIGWA